MTTGNKTLRQSSGREMHSGVTLAVASTNRIVIQTEFFCKLACSRHSLYLQSPLLFLVRTLSRTQHRHINTLLKGCVGTPRVQRLICRSASLFISGQQYANCFPSANLIAKPSKGQITMFVFISVIFPSFTSVLSLSAHRTNYHKDNEPSVALRNVNTF